MKCEKCKKLIAHTQCPDRCDECWHYINNHARDGELLVHHNGRTCAAPNCPCTRTYESLVGEKALIDMTDDEHAKWIDEQFATCERNAKRNKQMETELQLLILDLGNCCVVKVEKGELNLPMFHTFSENKTVMLSGHAFTALREAIEQKPVPRMSIRSTKSEADGTPVYLLHTATQPTGSGLSSQEYNALSELAGKPLPLWKGGTWEEVGHIDDHVYNNTDLRVWRYKSNA